jgi:DUF971 family protein
MSFWNRIKPAQKSPVATQVSLSADQRVLELTWSDGVTTKVSARTLRQHCPCAECVEEWSGKRTFDPESIPAETKAVEVHAVGNYALAFTFGDLHRTGIFQWTYLRELAEAHPAT